MAAETYSCDVAVIGGGMGGVAAALAACEAGASVVLSEATRWIGGQMTSQGVSALDEHRYIEQFGGTRTYEEMRAAIRAIYQQRYGVSSMPDGRPLNPGNGWVSRLCFEPQVGLQVLETMLAPHIAAGRLVLLREHTPIAARVVGDEVQEVHLRSIGGEQAMVQARFFLDATELGDLLPLTGTAYVTGAEAQADTGEPHAAPTARPSEIQGFTFCFAVEHRPGEDHTIPRPQGYEHFRDTQPYSFTLYAQDGTPRHFKMFEEGPDGLLPFWTYRRLIDGALLDPSGRTRDVALINWNSNDYHHGTLIDVVPDERARVIDEAKRLSLGFLHWLQTEAPRDDGAGRGYPGLRLLPEVMGTPDGLSMAPYVRESRRILALKRIVEGEIVAAGRSGARAAPCDDSVGIGWYYMDLHPAFGNPRSMFEPTLPFQIPLGALIPQSMRNLLAACKNIGTTHLTNGSYRLHPVEWNIGEAAGALAAFCCTNGLTPRTVHSDQPTLRRFQQVLIARGVPLAWAIDVPRTHPHYRVTQLLLVAGAIASGTPRAESLEVRPDAPLTASEASALIQAGLRLAGQPVPAAVSELSGAEPAQPQAVLAALEATGLTGTTLTGSPTWGELCEVLVRVV